MFKRKPRNPTPFCFRDHSYHFRTLSRLSYCKSFKMSERPSTITPSIRGPEMDCSGHGGCWSSLPAEVRLMILSEIVRQRSRGWAACAAVWKEWQVVIEPKNFHRLTLRKFCIPAFEHITIRPRRFIQHICLTLCSLNIHAAVVKHTSPSSRLRDIVSCMRGLCWTWFLCSAAGSLSALWPWNWIPTALVTRSFGSNIISLGLKMRIMKIWPSRKMPPPDGTTLGMAGSMADKSRFLASRLYCDCLLHYHFLNSNFLNKFIQLQGLWNVDNCDARYLRKI